MRRFLLLALLAGTVSACIFPPPPRHRPARHRPAHDPDAHPEPGHPGHDPDMHPEPGHDPDAHPEGDAVQAEAPPAPVPPLAIQLSTTEVRRGEEVELRFEPNPGHDIMVFFNEKPLPKKVAEDGSAVVVTVPGDAENGVFSVQWNDHTYDSEPIRIVP